MFGGGRQAAFFGAPGTGALLGVQVPLQVDHSERSEAQLREGDCGLPRRLNRAMPIAGPIRLFVGEAVLTPEPLQALARVNRSSNSTANWFIATFQSSVGRISLASTLRIANQISLVAASSVGKWPRFLMIFRSCMFRLSIAL